MGKFCCANTPPSCPKEQPPDEASSCVDTKFITFGGSFARQCGLIGPQVSFCCLIRQLSNKKYRVVLHKGGGGL